MLIRDEPHVFADRTERGSRVIRNFVRDLEKNEDFWFGGPDRVRFTGLALFGVSGMLLEMAREHLKWGEKEEADKAVKYSWRFYVLEQAIVKKNNDRRSLLTDDGVRRSMWEGEMYADVALGDKM